MSLEEICELGAILQNEDKETVNLERKKLELRAAIRQQEERVCQITLFSFLETKYCYLFLF
jgi:hypothetical protein